MQVTVAGLRGGVGTTSIVAMLADALSLIGETVLLIDLNSSDLLRLYFNIPYADENGWALSEADGTGWQQHTYQVKENLYVLPYGRHGLAAMGARIDTPISAPAFLHDKGAIASTGCSWVILDTGNMNGQHANLHETSDLSILVAHADMSSHILLGQHHLAEKTKIVVNQL